MRYLFTLFICAWPFSALADGWFADRAPLVTLLPSNGVQPSGASLFVGTLGTALLAARPLMAPHQGAGDRQAAQLRDLIARAEAGRENYDAVQHGARIKTPKPPTQMTLAEIDAWTRATPGQPHAIGRYQFIPKTLRSLVKRAKLPPNTRFSPSVQNLLADMLLQDAGFDKAKAGTLSQDAFMNRLARIWAGLPMENGRSFYDGYAGNKATIGRAAFAREIALIFR